MGSEMQRSSATDNQRSASRTKAVLPVRVRGKDSSGVPFEELAHTLDATPGGLRLGAVRRELNVLDEVTVFYRQRRIQYRVVWTKKLKGTSEFQIGLQALTQDADALGLASSDIRVLAAPRAEFSPA